MLDYTIYNECYEGMGTRIHYFAPGASKCLCGKVRSTGDAKSGPKLVDLNRGMPTGKQ